MEHLENLEISYESDELIKENSQVNINIDDPQNLKNLYIRLPIEFEVTVNNISDANYADLENLFSENAYIRLEIIAKSIKELKVDINENGIFATDKYVDELVQMQEYEENIEQNIRKHDDEYKKFVKFCRLKYTPGTTSGTNKIQPESGFITLNLYDLLLFYNIQEFYEDTISIKSMRISFSFGNLTVFNSSTAADNIAYYKRNIYLFSRSGELQGMPSTIALATIATPMRIKADEYIICQTLSAPYDGLFPPKYYELQPKFYAGLDNISEITSTGRLVSILIEIYSDSSNNAVYDKTATALIKKLEINRLSVVDIQQFSENQELDLYEEYLEENSLLVNGKHESANSIIYFCDIPKNTKFNIEITPGEYSATSTDEKVMFTLIYES